jgi:hypothetical protein
LEDVREVTVIRKIFELVSEVGLEGGNEDDADELPRSRVEILGGDEN